jgi:hypothetical protein
MTKQLFTLTHDYEKSTWTVTNTESGVVIDTFWTQQDAEELVSKVEARIAAKRERDLALYLYP